MDIASDHKRMAIAYLIKAMNTAKLMAAGRHSSQNGGLVFSLTNIFYYQAL
jgi:hypothetical protein